MKRKVKKFGRGGDILTGLGAGLIGYHLYDKYMGGDKDKDKDKELEAVGGPGRRPRTIEEQTGRKAEPKAESREEYLSKKTTPIKETGTFTGPDTAEPDLEYKDKTPKPVVKKAVPAAQPKKAEPAAQPKKEESTTQVIPKSPYSFDTDKPTKLTEPVDKNKPKGTQDVGKALGISSGAKGTQSVSERIKGTVESAGKSVVRTPQERISEGARQVEKRRQEEKAKKEREKSGMRSGGAVKKYASGGTVKSSASRRADGIAQRGKTRGRIC